MKSTRMVCSLVVLSSPLHIGAAATSSQAPVAPCWEVAVVKQGSLLTWQSSKTALAPTAAVLERLRENKANIPDQVKHYTMKAHRELKRNKPTLNPKDARQLHQLVGAPTYNNPIEKYVCPFTGTPAYYKEASGNTLEEDMLCSSDELTKPSEELLNAIAHPTKPLKSTAELYSSSKELVSLEAHKPFVSRAEGLVLANQDYIWTTKGTRNSSTGRKVWKPRLSFFPDEQTPVLTTLTAMTNTVEASVAPGQSVCGLLTDSIRNQISVLQTLTSDPSNRTAKDSALLAKEFEGLSAKAAHLFSELNLTPRIGYYIRAVIAAYEAYLTVNDEKPESDTQIFKSLFGSRLMSRSNRPAVVALCAEVLSAVEDKSATTGLWSYLGTYEPKEVTELNTCLDEIMQEADPVKRAALAQKYNALINTLHACAIKELNALIPQEKVSPVICDTKQQAYITQALRSETYPFESKVADLRDTLRQMAALQEMQLILNERNAACASTSSAL